MSTAQKPLSTLAGPKHAFFIMRRLCADTLLKSPPKARTPDRNGTTSSKNDMRRLLRPYV